MSEENKQKLQGEKKTEPGQKPASSRRRPSNRRRKKPSNNRKDENQKKQQEDKKDQPKQKTGGDQKRKDQGRKDQGRKDQGRKDQGRKDQGRKDQGRKDQGKKDSNRKDQRGQRSSNKKSQGSNRGRRDHRSDRRDQVPKPGKTGISFTKQKRQRKASVRQLIFKKNGNFYFMKTGEKDLRLEVMDQVEIHFLFRGTDRKYYVGTEYSGIIHAIVEFESYEEAKEDLRIRGEHDFNGILDFEVESNID